MNVSLKKSILLFIFTFTKFQIKNRYKINVTTCILAVLLMYISTFGRRNSTNGNFSLTSFLAVCYFLWLSTGTLYSSEYIFFFTEMLHFTFFINHIKCISDNNYSYVFPQVMMIRLQRLSLPVNEFSVAEGCVC